MSEIFARRNIKIQSWINFIAGFTFLVPVITLFYKYTGLDLASIILLSNISTLIIWLFEIPTSVFADTSGRKKSLVISVLCNLVGTLLIFLFPSFAGFIIASVFSGLYWCFWSGTGQAFLDDNLKYLKEEKSFGKHIGNLMALENLAGIITPLLASLILKTAGNDGYMILAGIDVIGALTLVFLTISLKELNTDYKKHIKSFKNIMISNIETAKQAFRNTFSNSKLKLLILYRTLANHVSFFYIISLPLLVSDGMTEWYAGIVVSIGTIFMMIANKFAYKLGEFKSYNFAWVISTVIQGLLLILLSFFTSYWVIVAIIYIIFNLFEGIWQPAWNHVLVEQTKGVAIATTRSIVFSIFALYTTVGKQLLSLITIQYALIISGIFIIIINIILANKILNMKKD